MITLRALGHSMVDRRLFVDLSYSLNSKKYGLVGPNGVGKTTLALILSGQLDPDEGHVQSSGEVYYMPQLEERAVEFKHLSGGEWMKLRLDRAFANPSAFLILDEPSNNLDREGREDLLNRIRNFSGGLLVISHDRELLKEMDVILELSNQGLSVYGGNFDFYWNERLQERENQLLHLEESQRMANKVKKEQHRKLATQEKRMRRGTLKALRGDMPKILAGGRKRNAQVSMGKIKNHTTMELEQAKNQAHEAWEDLKLDPFLKLSFKGVEVPAGKILISFEEVMWKYRSGKEFLWKYPATFQVRGHERWHMRGRNGSGKSTLFKLALNQLGSQDGEVQGLVRVGNFPIAYLDQNYGTLDPKTSVLENLLGDSGLDQEELRNSLALYGFAKEQVFQRVENLSGGERLKACLAYMFLRKDPPGLLLLDEPTNNLDLNGVELLIKAVKAFQGAVLLVSHDQVFVDEVGCEHIVTID